MDAVFIWIPKTSGTSIYSSLKQHGMHKLNDVSAIGRFRHRGLVTFGHISYCTLVELGLVSDRFHMECFKFCFVRNPFDRAVSLFYFYKEQGWLPAGVSFATFTTLIASKQIEPVGLHNREGFSLCNSQLSWLEGLDADLFPDFIGRFESITKDFQCVCDKLGVKATLGHFRRTKHKHYRKLYNDGSRRLIADLYDADINTFDYTF